jgi:hypothetical protein
MRVHALRAGPSTSGRGGAGGGRGRGREGPARGGRGARGRGGRGRGGRGGGEAEERPQPISSLVDYVKGQPRGASGIVYVLSRDESEVVAQWVHRAALCFKGMLKRDS